MSKIYNYGKVFPTLIKNLQQKPKAVWDGFKSFIFPVFPSNEGKYLSYTQKASGITLHYKKVGSGPPILLIHGLAHNWEGWIPLTEELKKNFTVYLVDVPGFGDSDSLPQYSIEIASTYIGSFLEETKLQPIAIIGASMGSFIVAHLLNEQAKYTEKAILIGPVIKNKNKETLAHTLKYSMWLIKKFDLSEAMLKKILETRLSIYIIAKFLNMYEFNRELLDTYNLMSKKKMRKEAYTQMTISCSDYNLTETILQLEVPTLLLYGHEDKISSPEYAQENVLPHNKNLAVTSIPQAGHIVPLEKPAEVAEAIRNFLQQDKKDDTL